MIWFILIISIFSFWSFFEFDIKCQTYEFLWNFCLIYLQISSPVFKVLIMEGNNIFSQ